MVSYGLKREMYKKIELRGNKRRGDERREEVKERDLSLFRDGFSCKSFFKKCEDKSPTVSIIKSESGYLFGGYAPVPWASTENFETTSNSFLFTLTNPHNIPPTKYAHIAGRPGVFHRAYTLVGFGGKQDGCKIAKPDLLVSAFTVETNFPVSYKDTTGKGNVTFTGRPHFDFSEIEVYLVQETEI